MRLKMIGRWVICGLLVIACATDTSTGPRFRDIRARDQQAIQQGLEQDWPQYMIYVIPERAVLFDRRDDNNTLLVSGRWIKVGEDTQAWMYILRENTKTSESFFSAWIGKATGFLEVIGPGEVPFGYLVHNKQDMVALKIIDPNTMRIYYSPQRTEGGP